MEILEQLLALEKEAAARVAAADTEAAQRKAAARVAAQADRASAVAKAAAEVAATVEAERRRIGGERDERNAAYRAKLAARPVATGDLAAAARRFLSGEA